MAIGEPLGVTGDYGQALAGITHTYLGTLAAITTQMEALAQQIADTLHAHPDKDIFTHLPKAGMYAPLVCSPKSATPAASSPPPTLWPASPA